MEKYKNKENLVSKEQRELISKIRSLFSNHRVMLTGSRLRKTHVSDSDFDINVVLKVPENLSENELKEIFKKHKRKVNEIIRKNFPNSFFKKEGSQWINIRGPENSDFSIISKIQIGENHREVYIFDKNNTLSINKPVDAILNSKKKEINTKGRFKETILYIRHILLKEFDLNQGGFILESLLYYVDDKFYLKNESIDERTVKILQQVIKIINEKENDELTVLGNNSEEIFKNDYIKKLTLDYLKKVIKILKEKQ